MTPGSRARLAAGALVAALLLAFVFRGIDWTRLGAAFRTADRSYLAGVVAATVVTYALRAWRWGFLLAPLGRVGFPRLFSATVLGFMTGLVVPRAGEILRPWLIARRHPIATSAGFATIIVERLLDLMTVLSLFALYLFVLPAPAAQVAHSLDRVRVWGARGGAVSLGVLIALLVFHAQADRALAGSERVLSRLPPRLAALLAGVLRAFAEGLSVLRAPGRHLAAIGAQSVLLWLSIALGLFWNNRAFGMTLPFHSAFLLICFLTVGVAIPTPGTVGGFHALYVLALTQVYGIDRERAAAASIAAHALTNLPVLLLGLVFLEREGLTMGKVAEMASSEVPAPPAPPTVLPMGLPAESPTSDQELSAISGGRRP